MQRSVPEVLQDIISNVEQIVRAEIRLAQTEMKEEAAKAARPGATFGAGVALAFYALGFLLLAVLYALAAVMALWLAALIVGAAVAMVALTLIRSGRTKLKRLKPTPDKTIRSLEENSQWVKQQIK